METGLSPFDKVADRQVWARGRLLVLLVVLGTATFGLFDPAADFWLHGWRALRRDQVTGLVVSGALCWYVLHGSRFAVGCFAVLYGIFFVGFAAYLKASFFSAWSANPDFETGTWSAVSWLATGAWSCFALWVLLISKDARCYLQARRRGLAIEDANAFVWPPAKRRG